jgi:hypothetical protein
MSMTNNDLADEILLRGTEDVIQLAEIISVARYEVGIPFGPEMFTAVYECLRSLVAKGYANIGDWNLSSIGPSIVPWPGDADTIAERAISEWKALRRNPGLGEVCWLELTELGRERGSELIDRK